MTGGKATSRIFDNLHDAVMYTLKYVIFEGVIEILKVD